MHKKPHKEPKPKKNPETVWQVIAGSFRSFLKRNTLRGAAFWLLSIYLAYHLSVVLQSLTKGALWLPDTWREVLGYISFLSSIAVITIVSKAAETKGRQWYKKILRSIMFRAPVTLLLLGSAAYSVVHTKQLRDHYMFDIPQTDQWWLAHYGNPENKTAESKTPANHPLKADDLKTPDYLSYEYRSFYFPYWTNNDPRIADWIKQAQLDAESKGAVSPDTNDIRACIDLMLTIEPEHFINDAEKDLEHEIRWQVDRRFLFYHFLTILSLVAAWGLLREEEEQILGSILGLLHTKA